MIFHNDFRICVTEYDSMMHDGINLAIRFFIVRNYHSIFSYSQTVTQVDLMAPYGRSGLKYAELDWSIEQYPLHNSLIPSQMLITWYKDKIAIPGNLEPLRFGKEDKSATIKSHFSRLWNYMMLSIWPWFFLTNVEKQKVMSCWNWWEFHGIGD